MSTEISSIIFREEDGSVKEFPLVDALEPNAQEQKEQVEAKIDNYVRVRRGSSEIQPVDYVEYDLEKNPEASTNVIVDRLVEDDGVVVRMGAVYALLADARSEDAISRAKELKIRAEEKTFGLLAPLDQVPELVDFDRVHPDLHPLLHDGEKLKELFGSKGFVRFPIKKGTGLSESVMHEGTLQVFSFYGDEVAFALEEAIQKGLVEKHPEGHGEVIISSYNLSKTQKTISDEYEARILTEATAELEERKHNEDPSYVRKPPVLVHRKSQTSVEGASYCIYEFNSSGVTCVREGTGQDQINAEISRYTR